jgi:hypothetical protein
MQLSVDTISPK